jgi:MYXO-CTERM domain-containing protein
MVMRRGGARWAAGALALALTGGASEAVAVTSSESVPSAFGGNGHNISFDGRLLIVRDSAGWQAQLLRPEAVTYLPSGLPDATGPLFSPRSHILGDGNSVENALAICEPDASKAPYACDEVGNAGGPYDCYDLQILYSDALTPPEQGGFVMLRRALQVWVSSPKSPSATIHKVEWGTPSALSPTMLGIEPTITRDGELLVYQGHPDNDGKIDILMYSLASQACAAAGWSTPKSISSMHADAAVVNRYALAERKLRAADGATFQDGQLFRGAYPWLMPEGDAIIFAATNMPCVSPDNPLGCGPRRNAMSVVGYATNWGIAHIDGGVNPDTNQTVRLFFSSPGPVTFAALPTTPGLDVWPFFGSNTSNYVELNFDDGLDGNYAGLWHFNESVNQAGELDTARTPDVSGYFNTGELQGGLGFSPVNDGVVGKSLSFDGVDDRVSVADAQSLNPVNGMTVAMWINPTSSPDCDAENNYRLLLGKGDINDGAYTLILEESLALHARVNVDGVQQELWSPPLVVGQWTHAAFEYDGATGKAGFFFDDEPVTEETLAAGELTPSSAPLTIGAPGAREACPPGDGAFHGRLDEVGISRYARHYGEPAGPVPGTGGGGATSGAGGDAAGVGGSGPGVGGAGANATDEASEGGCACRATRSPSTPSPNTPGSWGLPLLAWGLVLRRRRSGRGAGVARRPRS